jgi:hypothetical protein
MAHHRKKHALRRRYGRSAISEKQGGFATWADVLAAAKAGEPLYYKAPLDHQARRFIPSENGLYGRVPYTYEARARTIRMWPPGSVGRGRFRTSDPFTADAGHLDRFRSSQWVPM